MRKLKRTHKGLNILEAGFIYCKRRGIEYSYDTFIDLMSEEFHDDDDNELDNICEDLRCYRYFDSYKLKEITEEEYEMCVDEFGEII